MSTTRSTEERISQWLEEVAVGQLPDRVLDATFETTRGLRQSRASAWRPFMMSRPIPALVAVGAAAIIIVAGVVYFRPTPSSNVGGADPTPSPTPTAPASASPSPTPVASLDTSTWLTYASDRYGFSIGYPSGWTVDPSNRDWTMADADDFLSPAQEAFIDPGRGVRVSAWAMPVDRATIPETTEAVEAWAQAYCEASGERCTGIRDRSVPLCVELRDCHPGLLIPFEEDVQAFFTGGIYGDKMVVVAVWWHETAPAVASFGGSTNLLEAFLSTMQVFRAAP